MKYLLSIIPLLLFCMSCKQNLYPVEIVQFGYDYYKSVTQDGKPTNDYVFSNVSEFHKGLAMVTDYYSGKTGFIDDKGIVVIPPEYNVYTIGFQDDSTKNWYDYDNILVRKDDYYGVLNFKGEWLIELNYTWLERVNNSIFNFSTQGDTKYRIKLGLVKVDGREIAPEQYYSTITEYDNLFSAFVYNDTEKYYTIYNADGTLIKQLDPSICYLTYLGKNYFFKKNDKGIGFLDESFNEIFYSDEYSYVEMKTPNLITANKKGETVYFNNDGKILDTSMISYIIGRVLTSSNLIIYEDKNTRKTGLYSISEEKTIGTAIYDDIDSWRDLNVLIAKKNGRYGLLSTDGKELTDFIYQDISFNSSNNSGILNFKKATYYGLMDVNGNILHEAEFKEIISFNNNFAIVITKDNLKSVIDTTGTIQISPSKIDIKSYNNGLFIFGGEENFSNGVANIKGKVILKPVNMHGPYISNSGLITLGYIDNDNQIYDMVFNKDGKVLTKIKRGSGVKKPGFCG